ncbi:MAG TPA: hypothetical protein VIN11_00340, partial [Roseivirga sp.]
MNNTIFLDTSELIRGLESLAYPSERWSRERGVNRYSGLRLSYHLMTSDGISYDGNVREDNKKLINAALEAISQHMDKALSEQLSARLHAVELNQTQELALIDKSIVNASSYFQDCADTMLKDFRQGAKFGLGLIDIDKYLWKPIQGEMPPDQALDELMNDTDVTGRRFFNAIYRNEAIYNKVKNWALYEVYHKEEFGLLFTLFRIKLSEYRAIYLSQNQLLQTCYYEPNERRAEIIRRIPQEHGEGISYKKLLEEGMYRVWLGK